MSINFSDTTLGSIDSSLRSQSKKKYNSKYKIKNKNVQDGGFISNPITPVVDTIKIMIKNIADKQNINEQHPEQISDIKIGGDSDKEKNKQLEEEKQKQLLEEEKQKEEELKKLKQKELDDIVNQQQERQNKIDETKKKKKIKKIIYEDSSEDEEVETVIIRQKKETTHTHGAAVDSPRAKETQSQQQQRQPTFNDLANMSIQNQIHKKLNEEKFNSLYAQLVNCRY